MKRPTMLKNSPKNMSPIIPRRPPPPQTYPFKRKVGATTKMRLPREWSSLQQVRKQSREIQQVK
jgi:hypothetical protein